MWSKPQHHKPYIYLPHLQTAMEFHFKKILLFSGFDTSLVTINWLTKQAIFISVYGTIIFINLAYLFFLHILSEYSILFYVTFNRGSEFVSNFFSFFRHCSGYAASLHLRLPLQEWWTNQVYKPDTTSMYIITTSKTTDLNSCYL